MGQPTLKLLSFGENGVDFFFVLSGFIVAWVHGPDIGKADRVRPYLIKRFIRLFPILWVVVGCWILVRMAAGNLRPEGIGTSLFLYPSLTPPTPYVVWTLRHEFIFYCAFAILILNKRAGIILFSVWAPWCLVQIGLSEIGHAFTGLSAFFLSSFNLDFMTGMAVAYIHRRVEFRRGALPLVIAAAAVIAVIAVRSVCNGERLGMLDYVSTGATIWTLAVGLSFAFLLHGLLCAEGAIAIPKPFLMLGACSYSLYLVHTCLNSATQRVAALLPFPASDLLIVVAGVLGGWLLYSRVERPLSKFLRERLLPGKTTQRRLRTTEPVS